MSEQNIRGKRVSADSSCSYAVDYLFNMPFDKFEELFNKAAGGYCEFRAGDHGYSLKYNGSGYMLEQKY